MPAATVDLAVMGPVSLCGAASGFRRSSALELVVYLAFHRRGVRHREWAAALWPNRAVAASTLHSTASDARRALGRAPDGTSHLPRGTTLRLGPAVSTDVEQFSLLSASDEPRHLVAAMRLVRGPVFAGLRHADWAVFDGTQSEIESMVVRTALRAVSTLARCGHVEDAEWVVRRAMTACPYDERLYRALLRVADAQGNRMRLHATMGQLLTLAGEVVPPPTEAPGESGPFAALHPSTTALYRALLHGVPAAGGHPARL